MLSEILGLVIDVTEKSEGFREMTWNRLRTVLDMVELMPEPSRGERMANAWTWVFCVAGVGAGKEMSRVAEELHGRGVDPNAKDAEGWRAIRQQACYGHADVIKKLLLLGADPDEPLPGRGHSSAQECARANGHVDLADFLAAWIEKRALELADVSKPSSARSTSL